MHNLFKNAKIVRLSNAIAAGTDDTTLSTAVDTLGYAGCALIVAFGTITASAVTTIKAAQCDTSGGSYADLLGTSQSVGVGDDDKQFVIDIYKPKERYLKASITRATANAVVDGVWAILYNPDTAAPAADTTTGGQEFFSNVAEGTA